jgi:tetratricopeptide (TPR) repeat protein
MKKIFILSLCLFAAAGTISAQKSLVKEAEGKSKGYNADYASARKLLKPALTNAESKDDAQTWFVAGNIEFADYDNLQGKKAVGMDVNNASMGHALIDGYNYFMTAFPLDSVPELEKTGAPKLNKDGSPKVKTKYSKDMAKKIAAHYNDFINAGQALWDAKDYDGAYNAWAIYTSAPTNKSLGEDAPKMPSDTLIGEIAYFQGLAAWQAEKLDLALASFDKATKTPYKSTSLYDYAISVAAQAQNNPKIIEYAEEANAIYGDSISKYLTIIINDKINNEKYDEAQALLEKAIKMTPNNAELYDVLGVLYQSKKDLDKARELFTKALSIDPNYAKAQLDLGRVIYAQAVAIDEASTSLSTAEYNKVRAEKIDPMLKQAVPYLESALNDDNTATEARRLLRSLYYSLGDETNLKRIEAM